VLDLLKGLRVRDHLRNRATANHEPAEGGNGYYDCEEQQKGSKPPIRRIETKPEMNSDASVNPNEQEQNALQNGAVRPKSRQLVEVGVVYSEDSARNPRVDDVREQ
jgi:hypothetical protein